MKNRKGFTIIELLTAFVIMAFLLGIGVVSYNFIIDRVAGNYYDTLEEELLLAGNDYFTNNRTERPLSGYSAVQIDELVGNKYIETLKDRNGKVCDPNSDSKVYIYKTEKGYDYEVCLICNEHESSGAYCNNAAMGVINISASKVGGGSYNPLLSFANASWSNSDINVKFSVTVDVSKFVITDTNDGSTRTCDSISNKSCSMSFSNTSTYKVEAYNNGVEVAPAKGFNIKIDKEKPSCEFVSVTEDGNLSATYEDLGGSKIAYFGFSSTFSGDNAVSKQISEANTYKYYVKDKAGNENDCSLIVNTKTQYRYSDCASCKTCSSAGCQYFTKWDITGTDMKTHDLSYYKTYEKMECILEPNNMYYCVEYERSCSTYHSSCEKCGGCNTWGEFSEWSDTIYTESSSCKVETRNIYYVDE